VQIVLMGNGLILTALALWFLLVNRRVARL
jgi:hypothetical protein